MSTIDLDALEAVAAASGAIATAPVLALIARVRELEAIERERDRFQAALEELAALAKECPTVDTVDHFLTRALNVKEAEK